MKKGGFQKWSAKMVCEKETVVCEKFALIYKSGLQKCCVVCEMQYNCFIYFFLNNISKKMVCENRWSVKMSHSFKESGLQNAVTYFS